MYTKQTVIHDHDGWRVTSYGNGAAYLLEDTQNNTSVFFQGDDALQFEGELDEIGLTEAPEVFERYSEVMA